MFIRLIISVLLLLTLPTKTGKFKLVKSEGEQSEYASSNGERFAVKTVRLASDAKAYEALSLLAAQTRTQDPAVVIGPTPGTAGFISQNQIAFFKGVHFVTVTSLKADNNSGELKALAESLSDTLDRGENDIPVLLKHLPNPEEGQKNAVFLSSFADLSKLGLQQGVLSAVQTEGNADAALATYGPSKVLIVEFNTPQLASDNDQRIIAKIHELWNSGQPAPTAYRRVGNYSVFVFDAPNEQTAKQLIDQVKYEQVVQWLGDNPNILRDAEERYINTTLGVLIAVLKASGYALIGCLGIGGLIGALLFSYRRSQQKAVTAYSDAGGMLRLNLDELTAANKRR